MKPAKLISDTGKTVDDYRNIIKTLKVKLKRAETKHQEVEDLLIKIRDSKGGISSKQIHEVMDQMKIGKGTDMLMDPGEEATDHCQQSLERLHKSAGYLGLSLESLFRGCDLKREGSVTIDELRIFLQKVKLHLSPSEISSVLYVLDEDCSGVINYLSYVSTLASYGLQSETLPEAVVHIQQESVKKYTLLLKNLKINYKDSFNMIVSPQDDHTLIMQFYLGQFFKSIGIKASEQVSRRDRSSLW